ncbi:acetylcholine receptor subunit beta-type unc-29 [Teleopsis dalmanni]|uniref:acetylcholine receptor subunit beta-type unc-29 n=1 Tax=Teleopsis dalmanni TaxID=139649 RepID=UPI0018CFAA33|nr:acetylcholine receptor subunit beta-type unc-29 [Teleopsis dalmanni]
MNLVLDLLIRVCLVLSLNLVTLSSASKYNISFAKLESCTEYDIIRTGYVYKDFFLVHNLNNNDIETHERLHLMFYVLTPKDAHILLSVTEHPREMDRVYEIVIGAGGNTFSTIRTSIGKRRVATNQDTQILSTLDPTPIEIIQTIEGDLLVYIPGFKDKPLLNFTDSSPLKINYVSLASFGSGTMAKWFFDCKLDKGNLIEQEVRLMSPRVRLLKEIEQNSINETIPDELETVNFAFQILAVSYQQDKSILQTRMNIILYWEDSKLVWDPNDYENIDAIVSSEVKIWKPNVIVLNNAKLQQFASALNVELRIHSNGSVVMFAHNLEMKTWCTNQEKNWPSETLTCDLLMGINEPMAIGYKQLELLYDNHEPFTNDPFNVISEWHFHQIAVSRMIIDVNDTSIGSIARFTKDGIMQTLEGDISIELTIARNGSFYRKVFLMPFLTCNTLLILSFFLRGYRRGGLILLCFLISALGLMFMTKHAPQFYVPNLMVAYQHLMSITTFCYILHIVIIWFDLYPPKREPWDWVIFLINSTPLRVSLCMRFADANDFISAQQTPWHSIAKILNMFFFIIMNVYIVLLVILI